MPPPPAPGAPTPPQPTTAAPDLSLSFGKGPARGTSAPASPAKSRESLLQRVQSLTGAARDQGASIIGKIAFINYKQSWPNYFSLLPNNIFLYFLYPKSHVPEFSMGKVFDIS